MKRMGLEKVAFTGAATCLLSAFSLILLDNRPPSAIPGGIGEKAWPTLPSRSAPEVPSWQTSHSLGAGFALFTPPILRYDADRDRFNWPVEEPATNDDAFEVELLAVEQEPFRLQLVGYVGDAQTLFGVFERVDTGRTVVAKSGAIVPDLQVRIEQVRVHRRQNGSEGGRGAAITAVADVVDLVTSERLSLTTEQRRAVGPRLARIRVRNTESVHAVPVGGVVALGDDIYHVRGLIDDPPAADVSRESPQRGAITRRLPAVQ